MKTLPKLALALFVLPLGLAIGANTNFISNSALQSSYTPNVYLTGYTGEEISGEADILAPVFLRNDRNLFLYGEGRYGYANENWFKNPWIGSVGLGYRQIMANTTVLGAYVFGDYNYTVNGNSLWVIGPGIESLGRNWDFRANGYFPVSKHDWKTEGFAEDFGDYSHISFDGHTKFDHWFIFHEEAGIGTDAELGRKIFKCKGILVKAFINGYYFRMKDNDDIFGGGARVTISPQNYLELSLNYSYDNYVHSTFLVGAQVSLNRLFKPGSKQVIEDASLQSRLFDPIDRHLGALNLAGEGASVPISGLPGKPGAKPEDGGQVIVDDDVWFYTSAYPTGGDGTFKNPYGYDEFIQSKLGGINTWMMVNGFDHASIYFNPGTYPIGGTPSSLPTSTIANLYNGFRLYGKENGYIKDATGNDRALFRGGFSMPGNNIFDSIRLQNSTASPINIGFYINGDDVTINNTDVGADNAIDGYKTGISIQKAISLGVTLSNSNVYGYNNSSDVAVIATGISLTESGSILKIEGNNTISANAVGSASSTNVTAYGISTNDNIVVNISGNNNTVAANAIGSALSTNAYAKGINAENNSNVTISGNSNLFSADTNTTSTTNAYADGIATTNSNATISGQNNTFQAEATKTFGTYGIAIGIAAQDNSIINFIDTATGTQIRAGGTTYSFGILINDKNSSLKLNGSNVSTTTPINDLNTLVTFTKTSSSTLDFAILWNLATPAVKYWP